MTIAPLDSCGSVVLRGDRFARIRKSNDLLLKAVLENYTMWGQRSPWFADQRNQVSQHSSVLFDTVAVYLAVSDNLCRMELLPIRVNDDGLTVVDDDAKNMRVAISWKDREAFEDWLVTRLTDEL